MGVNATHDTSPYRKHSEDDVRQRDELGKSQRDSFDESSKYSHTIYCRTRLFHLMDAGAGKSCPSSSGSRIIARDATQNIGSEPCLSKA